MVVRHGCGTTTVHSSAALLCVLIDQHSALDIRDIPPLGHTDVDLARHFIHSAVDLVISVFSFGNILRCHPVVG